MAEKKEPSFSEVMEEISMILDSAELNSEELDEETKQELDRYLEELGTQESKKIDGFAQYCKIHKKAVDAIEDEIRALQSRAKSMKNGMKYVKEKYLETMDKAGLSKLKGTCYSIYVQERPKAVVPTNVMDIPEEYRRTKVEVEANKERILADLQAGVVIEGCSIGKSRWIVAR